VLVLLFRQSAILAIGVPLSWLTRLEAVAGIAVGNGGGEGGYGGAYHEAKGRVNEVEGGGEGVRVSISS
jgi:hypothetical protein